MGNTDTDCLEAFSVGVFAIAITLLVLEIRVPDLPTQAGNWELARALSLLWPSFLALAGSFGTILTMWSHHHLLFKFVMRGDRRLVYANGLLLLLVTFVPFPTALVARYLGRSGVPAATVFYCGTLVCISVAFLLLLDAIARGRETAGRAEPERTLAAIRRHYRLGPITYTGVTCLRCSCRCLAS